MKYLITGGCGFLGSNIAQRLIANNEKVIIFDNLSRTGSTSNLKWLKSMGTFKFVHGDIRNQVDVENLITNEMPDVIFHFAGQVAMSTSIETPRLDFDINVLGGFNLLESVRKYSPHSIIVYSSTNKVYGDLEYLEYEEKAKRYECNNFPSGFPEELKLDFHSPYGCSKGSADQYMLDYYRIYGIKTVVFRHSSMYGGRQFSTHDQGWIGWFCQKAVETKNMNEENLRFTISGNGKQVRDVLYASDMVDLYLASVQYIDIAQGQAFNIGGGIENSLSLLELFEIIENELDIKLRYDLLPPRESDQKFFVADIAKARNHFAWNPVVDKISGIKKMLSWVQSNA